jgi:hypothetical protein
MLVMTTTTHVPVDVTTGEGAGGDYQGAGGEYQGVLVAKQGTGSLEQADEGSSLGFRDGTVGTANSHRMPNLESRALEGRIKAGRNRWSMGLARSANGGTLYRAGRPPALRIRRSAVIQQARALPCAPLAVFHPGDNKKDVKATWVAPTGTPAARALGCGGRTSCGCVDTACARSPRGPGPWVYGWRCAAWPIVKAPPPKKRRKKKSPSFLQR